MTPEEKRAKNREKMRRWREKNPDKWRAIAKRSYDKNAGTRRECSRKWAARNADRVRENQRARYQENSASHRAYQSAYWKKRREAEPGLGTPAAMKWRAKNKAKWAEYNAARRAQLNRQTVASANKDAILAFYKVAERLTAATGVQHDVDHIVPLKGRNVCGLHVEWNLRVIPARENYKKGNRLVGTEAISMAELTNQFGK